MKGQDVGRAQELIRQTYSGYLSVGAIQSRVFGTIPPGCPVIPLISLYSLRPIQPVPAIHPSRRNSRQHRTRSRTAIIVMPSAILISSNSWA